MAHCRGARDEWVLWSQAGRKWDSKAPREDAYHQMHGVWASPRLDHWAHCLLLCWLLVYYPFTVPCLGPSFAEIKGSQIRGQAHLLCAMSLCPSSLESSGCVQMLFFLCVCNFVTNHFPVTFWSLRHGGQGKIFHTGTGPVGQYYIYSGDTDFSTGFLEHSLFLKF